MAADAKKSEYTTITITKKALAKLKLCNVDYYGLEAGSNSDKIIALVNLYEDRYEKPKI